MEVMQDTNCYSDWLRRGCWNTEMSQASEISISSIVLGELFHGFRNGNHYSANVDVLNQFLDRPQVKLVEVWHGEAEIFGELLPFLLKAGTPLPTNDIWIAACCVRRGATLLIRDRHFEKLPQVRVKWPEV